MQSFAEFITEGRDAPLYHASPIESAIRIIKDNMILGSEYSGRQDDMHIGDDLKNAKIFDRHGTAYMVSLSRSYKQALIYVNEWKFGDYQVVFELDQAKLAHSYKIIPFQFFGAGPRGRARYKGDTHTMNQSEEMVVGDIRNLNKYILRVIVEDYDKMVRKTLNDDLFVVSQHYKLYDMKTKKYINKA